MFDVFLSQRMSKQGKPYVALWVDMGYRKFNLVMDRQTIAELFDLSPKALRALPDENHPLTAGSIDRDGVGGV